MATAATNRATRDVVEFNPNVPVTLALKVHGTKPERKPPAQAKRAAPKKPRKGPPRDPQYLAWIRTLPSVISGYGPCEACHTGSDGGMSMKASDYSCVPMTPAEHREYHQIGKHAMESKYGISYARAVRRLMREWKARAA